MTSTIDATSNTPTHSVWQLDNPVAYVARCKTTGIYSGQTLIHDPVSNDWIIATILSPSEARTMVESAIAEFSRIPQRSVRGGRSVPSFVLPEFDDWTPSEVAADYVEHHLNSNPIPQEDPEQRALRRRSEGKK